MSPVLVVGRGFIGRAIIAAIPPDAVRVVGHDAIEAPGLLDGVAVVVHAGRHPALGRPGWSLADDLELRLAERVAGKGIAFVSLGTRKVLAPAGVPLDEDAAVGPSDLYGRQKLALEASLAGLLGPRLTRLRLANIFGYERDPARASFLTSALAGLVRQGEIRFDMSPFTSRDFLPVELCGRWIAALARRPPGGIVNVGSGIALPAGRLALWLIEGFGRGRLVIECSEERDAFVLDTHHLQQLVGPPHCTLDVLRATCIALGHRLRDDPDRT